MKGSVSSPPQIARGSGADCLRHAAITRSTILSHEDGYPELYAAGLAEAAASALRTMRLFVRDWRYIAPDAAEIVDRIDPRRFRLLLHELERERRGEVSGRPLDDEFLEVRMPTTMFVVSLAAARLRLTWGRAFHQLLAARVLVECNGCVRPKRGALRRLLGDLSSARAIPHEGAIPRESS